MSLIKWEPITDLEALLDRVLHGSASRLSSSMFVRDFGPSVDIVEREGLYQIKLDAPGMKREDLQVSVADNRITIQGERRIDHEETKARFHRIERSYGRFSRSFTLPADADPSTIKAHFDNGELTVSFAKKADASSAQVRPVPVE
jgi:HSP20 family protein